MFFEDANFTKKDSPIGIAWLLATLGPKNQARKISRKELIAFNLEKACEYISQPPEPLALRTSATLLYGVAKVYNQHFEEFYTNVNTFHTTLTRSIITDFTTGGNGGTGGTRGIDLNDDGKSRIDQITFGGIDLGWQSGLDFNFGLIDWSNPLGPARQRRASSKLDSQPSQQSANGEEENEEDEYASDDEAGVARKRARSDSTPGVHDHTRRITSIHHRSDRITPQLDDFQPPIDLDLGLDDFADNPDTSFSMPGEAFGDNMGDFQFDAGAADYNIDRMTPQQDDRQSSVDPEGNIIAASGTKSALKKRRRGSDESGEDEEEEAEPLERKKRVKKQRKVKWDQSLEMSDEDERNARQKYAENMEAQRREMLAKEHEKAVQGKADQVVDSAGGWLEFFDPGMKAMFATITKAGKWKWELDVAAQRAGKKFVPEEEEEQRDGPVHDQAQGQDGNDNLYNDEFDMGQGQQGDGPDMTQFESGYEDVFHDTMQEIVDPNSKPRRSQSTDVELGRRASQASQVVLPWHDSRYEDDNDFAAAPDSGFSPGSLHFSAMTPQEARLRLYSRSKSGTGSRIPTGPLGRRGRSRSGSVLQDRAGGPGAMLVDGPEDESLPAQEVLDLAEEPSQLISDVPDAFRPESLATIETQCRNFLTYVEKKMISNKTDEVDFDDVVDYKTPRRVAATAFYNCLTLATKNLLKVDQAEAFDSFSIRFTA